MRFIVREWPTSGGNLDVGLKDQGQVFKRRRGEKRD